MNLENWLKIAAKSIQFQEAIYLAKAVLGQEILIFTDILPELTIYCLNFALEQRKNAMPLAKIVQKKYFMNHCFITTEDTLDPRPETEAMFDCISIKPRSILELGVGTGCLIISLLKMFNKAKGLGIDLSLKALNIAAKNSQILQTDKRLQLKINNWATNLVGHFDLIVANPPYVDVNTLLNKETLQDPAVALFGDENTYKDIFSSINVSFYEFIIEVPLFLINQIESLLYLIKYTQYSFNKVQDGDIYMLKILGKKSPAFNMF